MIDGFLLVDKSLNVTSRQVCNDISHLFKEKKVGHIGTLDPFASGLLIICLGKANKAGSFILENTKTYLASLKLGISTDSGDKDGKILKSINPPKLERKQIEEVLKSFKGESEQIPPMTSAIHVDGKRLYEFAREGKQISRTPRKIHVYQIDLVDYSNDIITFRCEVSKGTYIRTLGEDIAIKLGSIGHLISLRREKVAPFDVSEAKCISDISIDDVLDIYTVLAKVSKIKEVDESFAIDVRNGKIKYIDEDYKEDNLLIVDKNKNVIAMYKKQDHHYEFKRGLF